MFSLAPLRLRTKLFALPQPSNHNEWSHSYGNRSIRYYSYARFALIEGLRACGLTDGATILIPAYMCFEVEEELIRNGFQTAYYHVDQNLQLCEDVKRIAAADAAVVVNYFGFATNLAPFRQYCKINGSLLIEDNSHGLFSRDDSGFLLGTRGDIGILCMRKTFPLVNGAAFIINDASRIVHPPTRLKEAPLSFMQKLRLPMKWLLQKITPFTGGAESLRHFYLKLKGISDRKPESSRFQPSQATYTFEYSFRPYLGLLAKLTKVDCDAEITRRIELYKSLDELLRTAGAVPVFDKLNEGTVPFAYAFRIPDASAKSKSFETIKRYRLNAQIWPVLPKRLTERPAHYQDVWFIPLSWQ